MRRVVITGVGAVTPIGNTVSEMWDGIKKGKCGIDRITRYDVTNRKVKVAAEVKNLPLEELVDKHDLRKMDLFTAYAMIAADEAMADPGLNTEGEEDRCGVIVSSGIGGIGTIEKEYSKALEKGFDRVSPYFVPSVISNMAAGRIAIKYNLQGMCSCVVTACAGGTNAVGDGFRQIRDGYADVMVCGGAEAGITEVTVGGFTTMKALCQSEDPKRASIPFDRDRSGFVMGEGAGVLILEELEHAIKRNAKIYGEIVGYA